MMGRSWTLQDDPGCCCFGAQSPTVRIDGRCGAVQANAPAAAIGICARRSSLNPRRTENLVAASGVAQILGPWRLEGLAYAPLHSRRSPGSKRAHPEGRRLSCASRWGARSAWARLPVPGAAPAVAGHTRMRGTRTVPTVACYAATGRGRRRLPTSGTERRSWVTSSPDGIRRWTGSADTVPASTTTLTPGNYMKASPNRCWLAVRLSGPALGQNPATRLSRMFSPSPGVPAARVPMQTLPSPLPPTWVSMNVANS
jgi:hypothetical protein